MACVYPEMLIPSIGLLMTYFITMSFLNYKIKIHDVVVSVVMVIFIILIVSNEFGVKVFIDQGIGAVSVVAGWDIFGPSANSFALLGNVFGLGNIFLNTQAPVFGSFYFLILILFSFGFGVRRIISFFRMRKLVPISFVAPIVPLFLVYLCAVIAAFTLVNIQKSYTNYPAIKFTMAYLWILYLFMAWALIAINKNYIRKIVLIFGLPVLYLVLTQSINFNKYLYKNAELAYFSESDLDFIQAKIKDKADLYIETEMWNFKLIAKFLNYGEDLYGFGIFKPDAQDIPFNKQLFVISFGDQKLLIKNKTIENEYSLIEKRKSFTLWQRKFD